MRSLGQQWVQQAIDEQVREPRAMVLVTANMSGAMSSRVMAILEFANIGILLASIFYDSLVTGKQQRFQRIDTG